MKALLFCAVFLAAQPAAAAFEDAGAGARGPGLGDAFAAVADDVSAIHYNPAGLGQLRRTELATSYSRHFLGLGDGTGLSSSFLGYAQPLRRGEKGTVAAAWEQFSVDPSLYKEQTVSLAYGVQAWNDEVSELHAGAAARYLQRSFGSLPEASNATNRLAFTNQTDPVLAGRRSRGALDGGLGLLYARGRLAVGFSADHLAQPDVAFSGGDRDTVPLTLRLGTAYRSLLSNLVAEWSTRRSPAGSRDHLVTLGAERWLARLLLGEFGVRGAFSTGTRDRRRLSVGLSHRTKLLQADYAFGLPMDGVAGTAGTHRLSLSLRFGRSTERDESIEMIFEAMKRLGGGRVAQPAVTGTTLSPTQKAIAEEYLAQSRALLAEGRYVEAREKMTQALAAAPADAGLISAFGRLHQITSLAPRLERFESDGAQAAQHQGILAYVGGDDAGAMNHFSQALSLRPRDPILRDFVAQMERATGIRRRFEEKPDPRKTRLAGLLTRASAALAAKDYPAAADWARQAAALEAESPEAWGLLGTATFALRELDESARAWRRALALETDPARRTLIESTLESIRSLRRRSPAPRPAAAEFAPGVSKAWVESLYTQGVRHYNARELEKAKEMFENILRISPEHAESSKALRRVVEELKAEERRKK